MIALVFAWCVISFVFYTFGKGAIQLISYLNRKDIFSYNLIDITLIGMCITASVIAFFSLFIPADTLLLFILLLICIAYWMFNNEKINPLVETVINFICKQPKSHLAIYALTTACIAMFCTLHPMMTDTLYYHYQNIMWNEKFAIVPGLANLQPRFGFNSSFFLLGSTFGLHPLFGQYIFGTHTLFLALIFAWVIYKTINNQNIIHSAIGILLFISLFVFYKIHITSVTTDFIPNLIISYLILKVIYDKDAIRKNRLLYFVIPVFIITLKLSCFSVFVITLYVIWLQLKNKKYCEFTMCSILSLFIVVPWLIRTVILSGYLIFPFPSIDLFSFDWKIPLEYAVEQKEFIQSFARYPNNIDIQTVLSMPISEWFHHWWNSDMFYYNPVLNRFVFFTSIITIPLGLYFAVTNRKSDFVPYRIIWFACTLGIIIWFFNAPDFRFIFSLLLGQMALVVLMGTDNIKRLSLIPNKVDFRMVLTAITLIFVCIYCFRWVYHQKGENISIVSLLKVPTSIEYTRATKGRMTTKDVFITVNVNGIEVKRKSLSDRDVLCFDCDLPCSADYVGGLELRGETLQDGFKCNPNAEHRLTY